jgi:hypothetical protein
MIQTWYRFCFRSIFVVSCFFFCMQSKQYRSLNLRMIINWRWEFLSKWTSSLNLIRCQSSNFQFNLMLTKVRRFIRKLKVNHELVQTRHLWYFRFCIMRRTMSKWTQLQSINLTQAVNWCHVIARIWIFSFSMIFCICCMIFELIVFFFVSSLLLFFDDALVAKISLAAFVSRYDD